MPINKMVMRKTKTNLEFYSRLYDDKYLKDSGRSKRIYSDKFRPYQIEVEMKNKLKNKDYLTLDDFKKIVWWKSSRVSLEKVEDNNNKRFIKEITGIAFKSNNIEIKLKTLTLLYGCSYPVASVILHFKYPKKFPIIDFRVLRQLGMEMKSNFASYEIFSNKMLEIANKCSLDLRTIDKALWKYDEENSRKKKLK